MSKFKFCYYTECDGDQMARLKTIDMEIPLNVLADEDSDMELREGDVCDVEVNGFCASDETYYYETEEDFLKTDTKMDSKSLIPMGVFPAADVQCDIDCDVECDINCPEEEDASVLLTGKITEVERDTEFSDDGEEIYQIKLDTLEMNVTLFLDADYEIKTGGIIRGTAMLFGDIKKASM